MSHNYQRAQIYEQSTARMILSFKRYQFSKTFLRSQKCYSNEINDKMELVNTENNITGINLENKLTKF